MVDLLDRVRTVARGVVTQLAWSPDGTHTLVDELERRAREHPEAPLLDFESQRWTYGAFNQEVNRCAHGWRAAGLRRGDVVALMMGNRPAFLFHLYGLAKLGVVTSLINPNLVGAALAHAVSACRPRGLLVGAEALPALRESGAALTGLRCFVEADEAEAEWDLGGWALWCPARDRHDPRLSAPRRLSDVFAYIYTSGTTGKPKPAIVKHHRFWRAGTLVAAGLTMGRTDAFYNCLPLYHANGVVIAASAAVASGARLVLARRFSASRFWDDVSDSGATHFIYIGEVCRYLLGSPAHPKESSHGVRAIIGNGLRPDVWDPFKERFGVGRIVEFYGSTEGNAETANVFGTSGSCGVLIPGRMALVRYDVASQAVARNRRGFCERVRAGEPGLLVGLIKANNEFSGYTDRAASDAKVLRDVFTSGDAWFNTGDLLKRDLLRRLYFVDRLGDTFRWKGENVATTDVAEAMSSVPGVCEVAVYGVAVPGAEGRAGMAALVTGASFDVAAVHAQVAATLPAYARPRFLRLVDSLEVTGTFKHRKGELRSEGFDVDRVTDAMFVLDTRRQTYVPLDASIAEQIRDQSYGL